VQAKILSGILDRFPVDDRPERRNFKGEILEMIDRLESEGSPAVGAPSLAITSDVVSRAIADAEALIRTTGSTSAVDRVHTTLHGYLKEVCRAASISIQDSAPITVLFRQLRTHHPKFQSTQQNINHTDRVMNSMATIMDALNPIRSHGSVAHPNASLLEEPEATLVLNASRTILQYISSVLKR
jgi:hypothetical protein